MIVVGNLMNMLAAATAQVQCPEGDGLCDTGLPTVAASGSELQIIIQIVLGVLAAVAVLMIVIGGFRFVTSDGNPEATKKARSTIVYAVVGLIIAISAQIIVSFVLTESKK